MKNKSFELVFVLDDDPIICNGICRILSENGYSTESAYSIKEARRKLSKRDSKQVDIYIFDVSLGSNSTSINFASEINQQNPKPTLFFTQHITNSDLFEKTRVVEHSAWLPFKNTEKEVILNGITLAKEKYNSFFYENDIGKLHTLICKDILTFKAWGGKSESVENPIKRHFIRKEDILFITADRDKNSTRGFFDNESTNYLVVVIKDGSDVKGIKYGVQSVGPVIDKLEKYKSIGWNFKRVQSQYIVNLDLISEWDTTRKIIKLRGVDKYQIPYTTTFFKDSDCVDWFPFLSTR